MEERQSEWVRNNETVCACEGNRKKKGQEAIRNITWCRRSQGTGARPRPAGGPASARGALVGVLVLVPLLMLVRAPVCVSESAGWWW